MKKDERGETAKAVFEDKLVEEIHAGKYDNTLIEIEVDDVPKPLELSPGSYGGSFIADFLRFFLFYKPYRTFGKVAHH